MGDARPVGVFDSGVGGLTVLRELQRQLPGENYLYLADSREAPYGTRSAAWIEARCARLVDYLLEQGAKLIVVACNAASSVALSGLRKRYPVPFVGIEPAVKPAGEQTARGRIGVLTTTVTAGSARVGQLIERLPPHVTVFTQECPDLVPLVERGLVDGSEVTEVLHRYLDPMLAQGVDVVVLGCTHYPFLREAIGRICGPGVRLLDPAEAVARQLGRVLAAGDLASGAVAGWTRYQTTGEVGVFRRILGYLGGTRPGPVARVGL